MISLLSPVFRPFKDSALSIASRIRTVNFSLTSGSVVFCNYTAKVYFYIMHKKVFIHCSCRPKFEMIKVKTLYYIQRSIQVQRHLYIILLLYLLSQLHLHLVLDLEEIYISVTPIDV